jgi:hypothetical protein
VIERVRSLKRSIWWGAMGIVEDPKVQARLLADARTGKLHPSVMTVLMAYAYGRPRDTTTSEPMIPMSEIEDARQSLEIKLQRIRELRQLSDLWSLYGFDRNENYKLKSFFF